MAARRIPEPAPPFSLRTALLLVLGCWGLVTIVLSYKHLFDVQAHQKSALSLAHHAASLILEHYADYPGNAAQSVEVISYEESWYSLVLVANYYGTSSLLFFRPTAEQKIQTLTTLQTKCAHGWTAWKQDTRLFAAVANYCGDGVSVYELELLDASAPDYGFRFVLRLPPGGQGISSGGSSSVLHISLPDRQLLAIAEYDAGAVAIHEITYDGDDEGASGTERSSGAGGMLRSAPLQRVSVPGASALTACSWEAPPSEAGELSPHPPLHFLIIAAYYDKSYSTKSAILKWDTAARRYVVLQTLATAGAHGAACFTTWDGTLLLALANSRSDETFSVESVVLRYSPEVGRFMWHQALPTVGAHAALHVRLAGPHAPDLLVIANRGSGESCDEREASPVFMWDPHEQKFRRSAHFSMACATGLAAVHQQGDTYLVVSGDRAANGSYKTTNHIWRMALEGAAAA